MSATAMDYPQLRRTTLRVFLAFLGLTAFLAILSVLLGSFGEFEVKVLFTTLTISAASVCAMCCAAYLEHGGPPRLGQAGIVLALVGGLLLIFGLWAEPHSEAYWKLTAVLCTTAGFTAHGLLLHIAELPNAQRWVQPASSVAIAALTLLVDFAILTEHDSEAYFRVVAVFGILTGLATLAIPILVKLRGEEALVADRSPGDSSPVSGPGHPADALLLTPVLGHVYVDGTGQRFAVHRLGDDA